MSPVRELASLLLRLKYNVHPVVSDTTQRRVGIALFPAACYLNHSCDPNAVAHTVNGGSIIVFRSLRPIPKGEPVTYTYIDLYQTRQQRRSLLQAGYLFHCEVCRVRGVSRARCVAVCRVWLSGIRADVAQRLG